MNIRLDKRKHLYIDAEMKMCPFCRMEPCGSWCALFTYCIECEGKAATITLWHGQYSVPVENFSIKDDYYENREALKRLDFTKNEGGY